MVRSERQFCQMPLSRRQILLYFELPFIHLKRLDFNVKRVKKN